MAIGMDIDSKTATNAAKRTSARLSAKITKDMKMMAKAISDLEKRIIADVKKLKTAADGTLVGPRANLKIAQKLHTQLEKQFEQIYNTNVKSHVKGYLQVKGYVEDNFNDLDVVANFTSLDNTMMNELANQSLLGFAQLGNAAKTTIEQALYNTVATNAPFDQLVGSISAALTGKLDKRGRPLSANATMYANDAIMNFYNSVHYKKGTDAGLEHFLYSGTIMANTRNFCQTRVGRVFTVEEINSWTGSWSGKSGPALTHRGGYNCRHHWQAVKPEWVPDEVIAQEERDYKPPTKRMLERAEALGGLKFNQLSKLQKSQVNKIGQRIKKGKLNDKTKYLDSWDLLSDKEKIKKWNSWQKKGYDMPEWFTPTYTKKAGGLTVPEGLTTGIPKPKPPKLPKPEPKIPTTFKDPEQVITGPISVDPDDAGLTWKQLDKKGKTQVGKIGKKMKSDTYNPKSVYVKTWNTLSAETQQMKIAQWKAKGIPIHPNLPIKGVANQLDNLTSSVAKAKTMPTTPDPDYITDPLFLQKQQLKSKYGIQQLNQTTYTDSKAAQLFDTVEDELDRISDDFPFVHEVLQTNNPLYGVEMVEGHSVGGSAAASYSDQTKWMKLPGQAKKKVGSMGKVGKSKLATDFDSIDSGYYDYFRHELGHTIDKGMRDLYDAGLLDWNHQDEWRTLYKKYSQEDWAKYFGRYSTTDKYEGFAEAFKIYTSPKYKAGLLPNDIEVYMNKALGGGPIKGQVVQPTVKAVKKSKVFAAPKNQEKYENYYAYYKDQKLSKTAIKEEIRDKCSSIIRSARDWQGTTQSYSGSALKLQAEILEAGENIKFFGAASSNMGQGSSAARVAEYMRDNLSDDEYIRLRALTAEYYDRKGIKTVTLSRGTDGRKSGPGFRRKVNQAKKDIPKNEWKDSTVQFKEPSLNGWSTDTATANSFGYRDGGVTVTTEIPTSDVLLSDELWPKTSYTDEYEWIVVRRTNQKYKLTDVRSGFGSGSGSAVQAQSQSALSQWKHSTPATLTAEDDIQNSVLHYIKQAIPDYQEGSGATVESIINVIDKKIKGIVNAAEEGDTILLLGKTIPDKKIPKLKKSFNKMKKIMKEAFDEPMDWEGWEEALEANSLNAFFG